MDRRRFVVNAAAGTAVATHAALASAQAAPQVTWRLASSFPKTLDTVFNGAELIAAKVAAATQGRFVIRVHAAGEVVPPLQVMDAVQSGSVECGHTLSNYYFGKEAALAFSSGMPFGLNARQQNAWVYHGGGMELLRELFESLGMVFFPAGNTGTQMGGWFRKEIKTVADLKGLKMRIGGTAGLVMSRLGLVPQQIPAGEIYTSLERGTIDAAEWVGPYDDEKLGFVKVAKYYYYPGWWEGGPQVDLLVNQKAFQALPDDFKAALEMACAQAHSSVLAKYDAVNSTALKKLVANGAVLKPFSNEILDACRAASDEVFGEIAIKNARFARIYEPWRKFRDDSVQWFSVAENRFDNYMVNSQRKARAR